MASVLHDSILERLVQHPLDETAADHLLAAVTENESDPRPSVAEDREAHAYLKSVTVSGFRGIGPTARIDLKPGPGLTVVCGRNGSGKSSFAEALEVLISGEVRRLKNRTEVWRTGWRSLHAQSPTEVSAELVIEGLKGASTFTGRWAPNAKLEDCEVRVKIPGEPDSNKQRFGWSRALELYRPFLSHAELEVILDKPSELHDQLNSVLGLEELTEVSARLATARKAQDTIADVAKNLLGRLRVDLQQSADPRATQVLTQLDTKKPDLQALETVAAGTGGPPAGEMAVLDQLRRITIPAAAAVKDLQTRLLDTAQRLERVGSSAAGRASSSAELLEMAVEHFETHGPGDCPVCGQRGALTGQWAEEVRDQIRHFRADAAEMDQAQTAARSALTQTAQLVTAAPNVLDRADETGIDTSAARSAWASWAAVTLDNPLPSGLRAVAEHLSTTFGPLQEAAQTVAATAENEYQRRQDVWSPLAVRIGEWCAAERAADKAREAAKQIRKAEVWLKEANHDLRNQRLQPYVESASHIWAQLRQESNVELMKISLEGSATRRAVEFDVTVDGKSATGLGVMSQGEVNALALSVFLPRATAEDSPFRFVVIDDPVQAMDPSKVDGLARVLAEVAEHRQVIVLTHDDRLPAAVRRLNLGGRIIQVSRKTESVIEIKSAGDPSGQLLAEAGSLAREEQLPPEAAARVVPGLCRSAIESACYEIVRARRLARGDSHDSVEAAIAAPTTLMMRLALTMFDDSSKGGEVYAWLNKNVGTWAPNTIKALNSGSHGTLDGSPSEMVGAARTVVERLREKLR